MLKRSPIIALLFVTAGAVVVAGCGGSGSTRKNDAGSAGTTGSAGVTGTAGTGSAGTTGTAGTGGDTGTAGTGGAGTTGTAGTGGDAGATAGAGGGAAGTGGGGAAGTGAAGTTVPPTPTATTAVILIDDVIVKAKPVADGGVADGGGDAGTADGGGGDAGAADGGDAGTSDAGPTSQALSYTFDTTTLGWHYTGYGSTPTDQPTSPDNLANKSMLVFNMMDDVNNKTTSGSLKGTVPFQFEGDQIDFQAFTNAAGPYNWTGYVVTAKVKLVSGGNLKPGCPLNALIYLSTIGYGTRGSARVDLVTGQWVTVTYDADDAMANGIDVTTITQMGLQINTGSACVGTPVPDAGTDAVSTDGGTDAPKSDAASTDAAAADAPADHAADGGVADVATGS